MILEDNQMVCALHGDVWGEEGCTIPNEGDLGRFSVNRNEFGGKIIDKKVLDELTRNHFSKEYIP